MKSFGQKVLSHEPREFGNRNDPGRFFGDGVIFKAKLIGILEVGEARGDRMCQEALQDLKMAIRAAGEHKQRITIHVTIDGLRLRDEKTGDSLYHHPVHKISFIAQDMTDSRAFGYIFGSPDSGHRFFGIKTDKAASQVVLAMRDLFQVVFELKKKEIEMARQQIQSKTIHEHQPISALTVKNTTTDTSALNYNKNSSENKSHTKEMSPESVADLVDLEQELSSLQRGITQMERITPSEPTPTSKNLSEEDPFGDSFTNFPQTYNLLPPPESSRSRHSKPIKPPDTTVEVSISSFVTSSQTTTSISTTASINTNPNTISHGSESWLEQNDVTPISFESATKPVDKLGTPTSNATTIDDIPVQKAGEDISKTKISATCVASPTTTTQNQYIDAFTDLDPLGTGKSKPYIDKKYFFQELKNPPKKVLKDLSGQDDAFAATFCGTEMTGATSSINNNGSATGTTTSTFTTTTSGTLASAIATSKTDLFEMTSENFDSTLPKLSETKPVEYTQKILTQPSLFKTQNSISNMDLNDNVFNIDLERTKADDPSVMMPRDTDPFSPTRKKSDPFQDGDIFSKLDPFDFDFANKHSGNILPDTKISHSSVSAATSISSNDSGKSKKDPNVFNGPLQVSLPPESWSSSVAQKKIERQTSESPTSTTRNRPSVFKQNTVDVISSISSKKMPHLFGQKFSKRDSNSINMRRLQESDSLSENETAPEPPLRPDAVAHIEPPPLPPKKQFSDIVIRPRITSSSAVPPPTRYDYVTSKLKNGQTNESAPPIPLPSRKVGRTDSCFPGPGRPGRKPGEEEDYLTPIAAKNDVPPLLPPPQTRGRNRRLDHTEQKTETENFAMVTKQESTSAESIIPDITLSQLLTLGIDELATKLNVPTIKLSTMTLIELTRYLSEFIENSKKPRPSPVKINQDAPVFKVSFDQNSDATFIAKFDDNFGEESSVPFIANFSQFDQKPEPPEPAKATVIPSADRYAVFREIIEQDMQSDSQDHENESNAEDDDEVNGDEKDERFDSDELNSCINSIPIKVAKIDTKITEAISQAKDRYAALRDIILVEDLFEKVSGAPTERFPNQEFLDESEKEEDQDVFLDAENEKSTNEESSPENNQNFGEIIVGNGGQRKTPEIRQNGTLIHTLSATNKDDLEIDEYMNRAISNLSLDSRDHLSPIAAKSPTSNAQNASTSPMHPQQQNKSPLMPIENQKQLGKSQFNDMSTSPIPQQKSPAQKSPMSKSPITKSPISKSPGPQSPAITNLIDASKRTNSESLSDVVVGSSPEAESIVPEPPKTMHTPTAAITESWAIFDQPPDNNVRTSQIIKSPQVASKEMVESPCSSDGKDEWKGSQDYGKRWPKGQTSSSSRDLSPWDDEAPDYKKRPPPGTDRHGYYMRHARRMNSCDDDYEYEEEVSKRRERRSKGPPINRSRENFDLESHNWYHHNNHHSWSPPEEDDARPRPFDRSAYERNTYGPPYERREHKIAPHSLHDRRDYKNYDKRKYYREYSRPEYDFEAYGESPDSKDRKINYYGDRDNFEKPSKCRRDYENIYEDDFGREGRGHKPREYFYDRERKSFDRESVESYESTGRRQKSFGSGDVYGSVDSREEFREKYLSSEKSRSLRKGMKVRSGEDYEVDSENEVQIRRGVTETRSLQRPPQSTRVRKSSGSSPWDGEEVLPPAAGQKSWKRPSSASESERRLTDNRRVLCHTLSGSDGEKDRRFRKKPRSRGKDVECRQQNFGTIRYSGHRDTNYDYIDYEEYEQPHDEDKFERLNRRRQDMHQRMMEAERRKKGEKYSFDEDETITSASKYISRKDNFYPEKDRYTTQKFEEFEEPKSGKTLVREFDFDDFEETPRSNASSNKFNFDDHGFESDFNSPPPTVPSQSTLSVNVNKSSYRFSNDFSEKEKQTVASNNIEPSESAQNTQSQKLRFDENVTVSKFESDSKAAFEDDFSKAEFDFESENQWPTDLPPKRNSLRLVKRQDNIKKSESVNIFARKSEDPFEDDDFFKSASPPIKNDAKSSSSLKNNGNDSFQWNSNFAKFDENM